jgi:hypothetical protein
MLNRQKTIFSVDRPFRPSQAPALRPMAFAAGEADLPPRHPLRARFGSAALRRRPARVDGADHLALAASGLNFTKLGNMQRRSGARRALRRGVRAHRAR